MNTWVLSIVRHLAIDALRLRRPEPFDPTALPISRLGETAVTSADQVAEGHDDADRLRAALRQVPVDQRRALVLAYAGLTSTEVAAAEGIPVGTAKTRHTRGAAPASPCLPR